MKSTCTTSLTQGCLSSNQPAACCVPSICDEGWCRSERRVFSQVTASFDRHKLLQASSLPTENITVPKLPSSRAPSTFCRRQTAEMISWKCQRQLISWITSFYLTQSFSGSSKLSTRIAYRTRWSTLMATSPLSRGPVHCLSRQCVRSCCTSGPADVLKIVQQPCMVLCATRMPTTHTVHLLFCSRCASRPCYDVCRTTSVVGRHPIASGKKKRRSDSTIYLAR